MALRYRRLLPCIVCMLLPAFLPVRAAQTPDEDAKPRIDLSHPNPLPVYPKSAQRIGEAGTAVILVRVGENGEPINVQLSQSAGFVDLDVAALTAVRHWHFIPAVKDGRPAEEWTAVRVQFNPDGTASGAQEASNWDTIQRENNRVICKEKVNATGSRLPNPKTCLPKRQWDEMEKVAKRHLEDITDRSRSNTISH